mmetsp:Transcript_7516/g.15581  ORF Transcript_7516/g.15581 Transcript_7516/m.15581 type:complete len:206 (+) Transcript_7516:1014-1631(+)
MLNVGRLYCCTICGRNTIPEHAVSTSSVSGLFWFGRLILMEGYFPGEGRRNTLEFFERTDKSGVSEWNRMGTRLVEAGACAVGRNTGATGGAAGRPLRKVARRRTNSSFSKTSLVPMPAAVSSALIAPARMALMAANRLSSSGVASRDDGEERRGPRRRLWRCLCTEVLAGPVCPCRRAKDVAARRCSTRTTAECQLRECIVCFC